ncbi:MAG TPA: diguanylate cyclase [Blastocatellia bacterium]|nr:diguanylate cyclase [Blastocatellia bacterium]
MERAEAKVDSQASRALIRIVSVIGLSIFAFASFATFTSAISLEWVLLGLVTVLVASRTDIRIPKITSTITISDTFVFISVLLYGVYPSVVMAGVDAAICSLHYRNKKKVMPFNIASMSLSVFTAGTVVDALFGDVRQLSDLSQLVLAAETLALIHYALNSGMVGLVQALRNKRNFLKVWQESFLWTSISYFAGGAAACIVVKLIDVVSFYAFIISVPMLAVTYLTYKNYLDKVQSSINHAEEMADLHLRTIEALAVAIDAKDEVTHDHVHRVQIYATGLGRLFGLNDAEIEALKAGAILHDIGKLAVPDYILNKPGQLTAAEFEKMKVHTIVGAEILERVAFPYPVVPVVRHHHERWDGRGYPDGLRGEEIPITARILSVVDCFDAVREDRQYRKAMTREEAIALLRSESGKMYDPAVVNAFLQQLGEFEAQIKLKKLDVHVGRSHQPASRAVKEITKETGRQAFESIRNAHREVITLYAIAQTIGTSLDLRDTFAVFSSRLQDIVSYTTCVLYLQKPETTQLEAVLVSGRNADRFRGRKISAGAGITGWVVANCHSLYNSDPRLDFDALKVDLDDKYRTVASVPLSKEGEIFGALTLYSKDLPSYEPDHLRLVEAVAKLASDAIANALHHERTEARALTDPMTGLSNARALRQRFDEELALAARTHDGFSLLMMDLDGFKSINDTLGHQAGDAVLREVAQLLATQIRGSDFVSRYAGDEFVAIVKAEQDEVPDLVARLQRAVEKHNFGFNNTGIFLGISIGWACYGSDGSTLDELLIAADRQMYGNKFRRKSEFSQAEADPANATYSRVM